MDPTLNHSAVSTGSPMILGRWQLMTLMIVGVLAAAVSVFGLRAAGAPAPVDTLSQSAETTTQQGTSQEGASDSGHTGTEASGHSTTTPATETKAAAASGKSIEVMIENYAYSPASLEVSVGDTVTWMNMDTAPHTVTVTSGPEKFDSGNLQKGESFSYTFKKAGTYAYYCAVHPDMKAGVTVKGASEPTPIPTPTEPTPTEPAPTPTPTPTHPAPTAPCDGLKSSVDAFMQHFYAAHLETSPGQQVADALDVDQYTKTHTVLVENMLKPLLGGATSALDAFLQHVYAAHLEASPGQQVADALDVDQYVKTHTVMVENMIKPLIGSDLSSC